MNFFEQLRLQKMGLAAKTTGPKPKKYLKKVSDKKAAEIKLQKDSPDNKLDVFFEAMRKKMKGRCLFCNSKTEKDNDETYRRSIAHLLPKREVNKGGFPSVSCNENNWIELCHFNNSCHDNFDRGVITWEFLKDSKEWEAIKEKLLVVLPAVAVEERKHKLYDKLIKLVYDNETNKRSPL